MTFFLRVQRPALRSTLILSTLLLLLSATGSWAQQTTANIRVALVNSGGNPVSGVSVRITHLPTARGQTITSNASGLATAGGLVVGGPYRVELVSGSDFQADPVENIFLELGRTRVVDMILVPAASIEEVLVTAKILTQKLRAGVGRDFASDRIEEIPSISRDFVSTIATDPKVLVDNSVARGPAVSMAGQNFRFNSVTIDGVAQNDNFGLSKNASATQRSPISIDAVEAVNVNLAPYDVTYGNFVGGNINIVTKSGTNEFHGSIFGFTTSDSLTGDETEDVPDLGIGDFDEDVYGFNLGGPIIEDKLFFFVNYEKFETTLPSNTQTIDNIAGVEQADVDEAIEIFNTVYGFDPGRFADTDVDEDEKLLIKLDWNINDDHRAVASYQRADGDVLFDDFPEIAALQSNRYNINEKLDAYSVQLFSNWTNNLSTEFKIGTKDVENRQISVDTVNPDFAVTAPGGGTIAAGGDRFRHTNELDNESDIFKFKADYILGDHTITAGWEREKKTVRNLFLPFSKGQYIFNSLDDLRNRNPFIVLYGNSNTGVGVDAEANFSLTTDSFFIQDEWLVNQDFTLTYGLRFDELSNDDDIPFNPAFAERNGFDNTENLDGKDLVAPRIGFTWTPTDRLTLRGGAGLFGGGTPLIVLSNSYSGNGITRTFASFFAQFFGPPVSDIIAEAGQRLPDPNAGFDLFQPLIGVNPLTAVDAIDPDFEILSSWKYSVGADYALDLSGWGWGDDWNISADIILTDVKDGYDIYEGRRIQVGTAPDGRPIYDFPADGDYIVTNTGDGSSEILTLGLDKAWDLDIGTIDMFLGYTYQDVDEVRSYNRFVGFETYAFDAQFDLNNPVEAPSKFEVENRFIATGTWRNQIWGDNDTSVSVIYQGRSGRHWTPVFGSGPAAFGGTFLADFGSEGDNPGGQLFYVPTGVNDPIVTGDPGFLANLDSFIDDVGCLAGARGQIVQRNSCTTDFIHLWNLRFTQEVGIGDNGNKLEFIMDIENFGNLLNDDWGRVNSYTAPSNVALADVSISPDGSQYIYSPAPGASGSQIVARPAVARLPSTWRIQLGVRFRF